MDGFLTKGTMAEVLMNGMTRGVLLDGTKFGNKLRHLHQCPEVVSLSGQAASCQVPL